MTRIFNIISWVGIALVVAALGVFSGMPEQAQYARYLAWAGLACIVLYILSIALAWIFGKKKKTEEEEEAA